MHVVVVEREGRVERADAVDPAWLEPGATTTVWVDIEAPDEHDRRLLLDTFRIHELAVEDALEDIHYPKIETYDGLLYLILHGITPGTGAARFETQDMDFFIASRFLVTVHKGPSRSITAERDACLRRPDLFADGPAGLCHRIVDRLVDHYGPEVDDIERRLEVIEGAVFESSGHGALRDLLVIKRDIAVLRRVALPQRDAIGRLARRKFPQISETLVYRFRDVYDQFVRLSEQAILLQDRATGLVDAFLSNQSNRLNQVMKVLTVISTIFMPLSVITGLWGMNVSIPEWPGGPDAQVWWIVAIMLALAAAMLVVFRRMRWL